MNDIKAIFYRNSPDDYFLGHQAAEIFKQRVYDPILRGKKDLTILDVGGNIGLFTIYAHPFAKKIHILEPAKEHAELIEKMIEFNNFDNVSVHRVALSNENGTAIFSHNTNKTMFSLSGAVDNVGVKEEVKKVRLDTFFDKNKIDHVDFMKLDTEGEEYNIICGEGFGNVAQKIDAIVIERHAWASRNPVQIDTRLLDLGYKIERIPNEADLILARR